MDYLNASLLVLCIVTMAYCAVCLAVHIHRQKRWKETVCDYIGESEKQTEKILAELAARLDKLCTNVEDIDDLVSRLGKKADHSEKKLETVDDDITCLNLDMEKVSRYKAEIDAIRAEVENLKLDYREAQNAASQINDYAGHLANIFIYDPLEEMKKARKESGDG